MDFPFSRECFIRLPEDVKFGESGCCRRIEDKIRRRLPAFPPSSGFGATSRDAG
jgi:hypothetical protein